MKYKIKVGNKYLIGEIKLIDADAEETIVHCNNKENAKIIATILNMDSEGHYLTYSSIFGEMEEPAPPKEE